MIVAESIGFAATHTISSILRDIPKFRVTHGSQNFETGGPIGSGSQTPEAFAASMAAAAARGAHPIALHTNFDPRRLRPACTAKGIRYSLLVRKPEAQVESCYAWALRKVLEGEDQSLLVAIKTALPHLPAQGIPANLPNLVYAYALMHVCRFNLVATEAGAEIMRMEDLLGDEARFRAAFDVPGDVRIPHFEGNVTHLASHRSKAGLEAVAPPDRALIRARLPVAGGGAALTLDHIDARFGYAA
ncbi:MAG: hypothetical protein ACU0DK_15495 [Pseudooceanicola sp.]